MFILAIYFTGGQLLKERISSPGTPFWMAVCIETQFTVENILAPSGTQTLNLEQALLDKLAFIITFLLS